MNDSIGFTAEAPIPGAPSPASVERINERQQRGVSRSETKDQSPKKIQIICRSTTTSIPPRLRTAQAKHVLPFSHPAPPAMGANPLASPSWGSSLKGQGVVLERSSASDARAVTGAVTVKATISILDAALRVIRINFAQFNLGQNDAREPVKHFFNTIPRQGGYLDGNRNIRLGSPARRLLEADFPPLGGPGSSHPGSRPQMARRPNRATGFKWQ